MNPVRMMRNVLSFLPCRPENGFRWRLFELYRRITRFYRRFNSFWARIYTLVGLILLASIFGTVPFGLMRAGVALGFLVLRDLTLPMNVIAGYAIYNVDSNNVNWISEPRADRKAASTVGAAAMVEALAASCADEMRTVTHQNPGPFGRIKHLRIGWVERA